MITAYIRVQLYAGKSFRLGAFVPKGRDRHGIARGPIRRYVVSGPTWKYIRTKAGAGLYGRTDIGPSTVDDYTVTGDTRKDGDLREDERGL
jgi:hypothetical protein